MHRKSLLSCSLLLSIIFISSCNGVKDIEITDVNNFVLNNIEQDKVNFSTTIGVRNPSSIGLKISEINVKTIIDGNFIGTLTSPDQIKIPALSDSSYQVAFSLQFANILTGVASLYNLTKKKKATVEIQGYIKAKSWFTVKKVEVHETRIIDVPSIYR